MSKKPRGNIHKIREFELEKIQLIDEFDILQIVGEGWFGKILLVEHRASQTEMVLKAVPKPYVSLRDFYREFHYGLHLGIHRNVVTTYDVAFETAGFYVFTQEYAPMGDLTSNVTDTGVGEVYSKRVAKQIASALDYMHSKDIVHRDVKLDNVLIYRSDFSRVKLCDFGESYQTGTVVERRNEWLPYSPPEVLDIKPEGTYKADPSHDVWQFAIVIFVCLTGCLPWQKAASDDPRYVRYLAWHGAMMLPIRRTPKLYKLLTSRAQRMFRRFLEPRADRRPKSLADLTKFLDDRWLAKTAEKEMAEYETDELCPSMYSFHSSPDEKHRLLYTLADCGIETNVDRQTKKNRIKDWIESSVITEEDEEENEENNSTSPSSSVSREPVAGHISSIRATADKAKDIKSTLKDATQKHFDPRTGALQQGPSEMGATLAPHQKSVSPSNASNMSTLNNGDSLCGSLLTLGSRQDLLGSNLHMFTSDMELNRLGELNSSFDAGYLNQSLSSGNLLTLAEDMTPAFLYPSFIQTEIGGGAPKNSIGVGTSRAAPAQKSILQRRSKSDSVKNAMYASTPVIDSSSAYAQNYGSAQNGRGIAPNGSAFFSGAAAGRPNNTASTLHTNGAPNNNSNNKTVTFSGLANNFQSLAQISTLPANAYVQQQQQQQQTQQTLHYFNRSQNDSQVKDSAYGSTDIAESSGRNALIGGSTGKLPELYPSNGKQNNFDRQQLQQQQQQQQQPKMQSPPPSSVRTQSSQQQQQQQHQHQRLYAGALSNSMKDTAYDRVAITNSNAKKRR